MYSRRVAERRGGANDGDLAEARELAHMFMLIAERARSDFDAATAQFDLPVHLSRAVLVLRQPTSMREVAEQLACDPSNVTGIADQLEMRGLGARTTGADRRVKLIELTPAGEQLRACIAAAVVDHGTFAGQLSRAQRRELRGLLEALLEP